MRDLTTAVLEQSLDQVGSGAAQVGCSRRRQPVGVLAGRPRAAATASGQMLVDRGLPAAALELEITEDFLMGDRERAREILTELRGSGHPGRRRRLRHRLLLAGLPARAADRRAQARPLVRPADVGGPAGRRDRPLDHRPGALPRHDPGRRGVEDEATAGHLAVSGCDESQGFFFSRPSPPPFSRSGSTPEVRRRRVSRTWRLPGARPLRPGPAQDLRSATRERGDPAGSPFPGHGGSRPTSALARTAESVPATSETVRGFDELVLLSEQLDELAVACAAPMTARPAWVFATLSMEPDRDPWGVVVRDDADRLVAAALLVDQVGHGPDLVRLAGSGSGHRGALLAHGRAASERLGHALADALVTRTRSFRLSLGPVDATSSPVDALTRALPGRSRLASTRSRSSGATGRCPPPTTSPTGCAARCASRRTGWPRTTTCCRSRSPATGPASCGCCRCWRSATATATTRADATAT